MSADHADVGLGIEVEARGDVVGWRDRLDLKVLPRRVVALALDVSLPGVRRREDGAGGPFELGQVPAQPRSIRARDTGQPPADLAGAE
jgi:hypothetical protein